MSNNNDAVEDVFVYMGAGSVVPRDVVRVRVHTSVTAIPEKAFNYCTELEEIELCEGLLSIGRDAFNNCKSLTQIFIPSTVTNIGIKAFTGAPLQSIQNLHDGIERIGNNPFCHCKITQFRVPASLVASIRQMFVPCNTMFSFELPQRVMEIDTGAFMDCSSLHNLALQPPSPFVYDFDFFGQTFAECDDLQQLFGSGRGIFNALKCRFNNLPIHKMLYYQSYNNVTSIQLNNATDARITRQRQNKLDPTGMQQDCLGMTPLHILTCSTIQNIELYKVLVEKYPKNLITEDRWGAIPLLYALWGKAPDEIVLFLVKSYQSLCPDNKINWNKIVETLGGAGVIDSVQTLVDLQQKYFPEECIEWETVLENVSQTYTWHYEAVGPLLQLSISKRVKAIGVKKWRDEITNARIIINEYQNRIVKRRVFISETKTKLAQYEDEYHRLKEATSILELTLWKHKIDEITGEGKKRKHEESNVREQSRIGCGADIIIEHVLPYLIPLSS